MSKDHEEQDERAFLNLMLNCVSQGLGPERIAQEFAQILKRTLACGECRIWLKIDGELVPIQQDAEKHTPFSSQELEAAWRVLDSGGPGLIASGGYHYLMLDRVGLLRLQGSQDLAPNRQRFLLRVAIQAGGVLRSQMEKLQFQLEAQGLRQRQEVLQAESDWLFRSLVILQDSAGGSPGKTEHEDVLQPHLLLAAFLPLLMEVLSFDALFLVLDPARRHREGWRPNGSLSPLEQTGSALNSAASYANFYTSALTTGEP